MEEKQAPKNKTIKVVVAVIVAAVIVVAGIRSYINSKSFETTDNAQLDGDLLPVRAGISGYIASIRFQDNQEIKEAIR